MTLIEAMGTGLPIAATNVGGIPDMLKDGVNALLTEVNADALTDAFIKLYSAESLREKLGRTALVDSVVLSSDEMAKKYVDIYIRNNRT